jgi:hypothetical protein
VLAEYIDRAMEQAVYEIIEDDGMYWEEIPGLQGDGWSVKDEPVHCCAGGDFPRG